MSIGQQTKSGVVGGSDGRAPDRDKPLTVGILNRGQGRARSGDWGPRMRKSVTRRPCAYGSSESAGGASLRLRRTGGEEEALAQVPRSEPKCR